MVKKIIKKIQSYLLAKVYNQRDKKIKNIITYYPRFNSRDELSSHYHRASWYLPRLPGVMENVYLFQKIGKDTKPGERPSFMCTPKQDISHILVKRGIFHFFKTLFHSRLILVWKNYKPAPWKFLKHFGVQALNVDTNDLSSIEYGRYCDIFWLNLLGKKEKYKIVSENYQRFYQIAYDIKDKNYSHSCVFGTGPSLEKAYDFDFSGCLTIICNSIVQDKELLDQIKPTFICAGDVVSHFGVSRYAEKFREDLIKTIESREVYFLTTASFGYLFTLNHPGVREKTILVEQAVPGPNYDLLHGFGLPLLASTLNIHMLPLAATFTDEIFLLGCDGKSTEQDNEDFWAHARSSQYYDLVDSGHLCHPTFDVHRRQNTYKRYLKSMEDFITIGENNHGKTFLTLQPSNIPILKSRQIPGKWISPKGNERVVVNNFPGLEKGAAGKVENQDLPIRSGISEAVYDREGSLFIRGWIISPLQTPIERIDIFAGDLFLGTTMLKLGARAGAYTKNNPGYDENWFIFQFYGESTPENENLHLVVQFLSNRKIVEKIEKRIKMKFIQKIKQK